MDTARIRWIYPIYIPSYTRAGIAPLLNLLSQAPYLVQHKVNVIVRREELEAYRSAYPWARFVVVKLPGLGPARMRALRDADKRGHRRIVMIDDDIRALALLERTVNAKGERYAKRYSPSVNGLSAVESMCRTLAVTCKITDGLFTLRPHASYGAARNALFSGPVADPDVAGQVYKQSFPSCVMFFDLDRFPIRRLPKEFHFYGEDIAMFLANITSGMESFQMPCVAYDQSVALETTIPLDPTDSVGRRVDMDNAAVHYPAMHPYLRESVRNKAGGVMRIGINWKRWNTDTGHTQVEIPLTDALAASTKEK
jgi:hypothetical protein